MDLQQQPRVWSLLPRWRSRVVVLLVEHDERTRRAIAAALRRDGHRVVEQRNGDDALDWLGPGVVDGDLERIPDLVVCDVHLPFASGLEICELLQVCTRRVPVILFTRRPDRETQLAAARLGARCLLETPFGSDALCAAVHDALGARHVGSFGAADAS